LAEVGWTTASPFAPHVPIVTLPLVGFEPVNPHAVAPAVAATKKGSVVSGDLPGTPPFTEQLPVCEQMLFMLLMAAQSKTPEIPANRVNGVDAGRGHSQFDGL